jgi:hypothetical protein
MGLRETLTLKEILEAAKNGDMSAGRWLAWNAPELASLVLDMGEALRRLIAYEESYEGVTSPDNALLARLDQLGKEHGDE